MSNTVTTYMLQTYTGS